MSNAYTILLVEDERSIVNFIRAALTNAGYRVLVARSGAEAGLMIASYRPDLILLDLGLPDMDGLDIIRQLRQKSQTPVIVVSARSREQEKVEALDLGADDYVTKPFGTEELLARVRTAIRHVVSRTTELEVARDGRFTTGALTVDFRKRRVYVEGEDAGLTKNEYNLVALLARYAGRVLTYDYLLKCIWGDESRGNNQILRVNMANIRRKIEKDPADPVYIFTEIGVGYRMADGTGDSGDASEENLKTP